MDCLDLLAVQGTLKSLLQHHSSKASVLWHSAFFIVQLSHPYMTTGKTIALTRLPLLAIFLLLNMLSRLVLTFLPRSKSHFISWLQSPSAVIVEPKIKSLTVSFVYPSIFHEVMGVDAMIFLFWMLSFKRTFSLSSFTFIKLLAGSGGAGMGKMASINATVIAQAIASIVMEEWGSVVNCLQFWFSKQSSGSLRLHFLWSHLYNLLKRKKYLWWKVCSLCPRTLHSKDASVVKYEILKVIAV